MVCIGICLQGVVTDTCWEEGLIDMALPYIDRKAWVTYGDESGADCMSVCDLRVDVRRMT